MEDSTALLDMRSGWEDLTVPGMMKDLEKAECGRHLYPDLIDRYQRDMFTGCWHATNQGLAYDTNGILRDGQHRGAAFIGTAERMEQEGLITRAEDYTMRMWVTRNLPPEAFNYLDTGRGRTFTDILDIQGRTNATILAAILRKIVTWEAGQPWTRKYQPTNSELEHALERHPEAIGASSYAKAWNAPVVAKSMAGFTWWLLGQIDLAEAEEFMEKLRNGSGAVGEPVHVLRERLLRDQRNNKQRGSFMRQEAVLWLIVRAWNYQRSGKPVSKLQIPVDITDESFVRPR